MPRMMTRQYADEIIQRLSALSLDTKPKWGTSTLPQILGHLTDVVRYTMGEGPDMLFKGNWKTRTIFRTLIINQIVAIPHNVRIPRRVGSKGPVVLRDGDLESLKKTLDEYLSQAESGNLASRIHPFFGELSAKSWRKFHVAHFTHHLNQFGA
ncbi:MAG: DUF1569 domain-containing protein [Candidatus Hydrogenedentes bacterium]|nr:DUF1569 domain-containing protein [Candidatus Hydrogenedentota bacterium]